MRTRRHELLFLQNSSTEFSVSSSEGSKQGNQSNSLRAQRTLDSHGQTRQTLMWVLFFLIFPGASAFFDPPPPRRSSKVPGLLVLRTVELDTRLADADYGVAVAQVPPPWR